MRLATILTFLGLAAMGYFVGYLSGLIVGAIVSIKRFEREQKAHEVLQYLDQTTDWVEDYE